MLLPLGEFLPWTTASFPTESARDTFLRDIETRRSRDVEVVPLFDDARRALVRWREGHFFEVNDTAYAHGGRIVVTVTARRRR